MTRITFIEHNGTRHVIDATDEQSLMQAAVDHMIPGIVADCGGACSCGTCHAYIDAPWAGKLAPPKEDEATLLDGALHVEPGSRLTCQIKLSADLDGLVVRLPVSQF